MNGRIRVEINSRDEFWGKALLVEWADQYPERGITNETNGPYLLIEGDWLSDLERIAGDCFSEVLVAPANPGRRSWLRIFIPWRKSTKGTIARSQSD